MAFIIRSALSYTLASGYVLPTFGIRRMPHHAFIFWAELTTYAQA